VNSNLKRIVVVALIFGAVLTQPLRAEAIQGCTLKNPDRDIRTLFPAATDYRTHFIALSDRGGEEKLKWLRARLQDVLDPVYEAVEVPYAYYEVLEGEKLIGYVFGVNQKGKYGGMQIIVATDLEGKILRLYFQKLSSPDRAAFKAEKFTEAFTGLTLADFYYFHGYRKLGVKKDADKVGAMKSPAGSDVAKHDFEALLRGVMKALILFDSFWLKDRNEPVFEKISRIVEEKGK
jgi:hypothetical protein